MTRKIAGVQGLEWDFLNKMERKRHASEYLADSGPVSVHFENAEWKWRRRGAVKAKSVEGWLLLRLIQSTVTLFLRALSTYLNALVDENRTKKKKKNANKNIGYLLIRIHQTIKERNIYFECCNSRTFVDFV